MLGQRRVYILPTRAGITLAVTLLLMLVGSINYNLSLGFILTFLLAGAGIVSILHTWRNLANVALVPGKSQPVFIGELAGFNDRRTQRRQDCRDEPGHRIARPGAGVLRRRGGQPIAASMPACPRMNAAW